MTMEKLLAPILAPFANNEPLAYGVTIAVLLVLSVVAYLVTKRILFRLVGFVVKKSSTTWDDILLERGVFSKLAWLAPAMVFYYAAFQLEGQSESVVQRLVVAYMQVVLIVVVTSVLNSIGDIWSTTKRAKDVPIKGYLQVAKLVLTLLGGIIVFGTIVNRSPWGILSGIGAATAIILLVFKDTILSFVASIQIASTGAIRLGDWISMPKYGADGDVVDIALHRVTIQNWNKTLTAIPTHKFLDESFTNWRGMSESGGRRICRAIHLDQTSVRFLDEEMLARLSKVQLLESYLEEKQSELENWNAERGIDGSTAMNGRRLTNIGTFRAYLVSYLKENPNVHQDMTFLVRQLAPGPEGVGIQIYVFSNDIAWANYEAIQADIFDHILASLPEFGLRVFQNPTGADFRSLHEHG